jgi:hypothetical protein
MASFQEVGIEAFLIDMEARAQLGPPERPKAPFDRDALRRQATQTLESLEARMEKQLDKAIREAAETGGYKLQLTHAMLREWCGKGYNLTFSNWESNPSRVARWVRSMSDRLGLCLITELNPACMASQSDKFGSVADNAVLLTLSW